MDEDDPDDMAEQETDESWFELAPLLWTILTESMDDMLSLVL